MTMFLYHGTDEESATNIIDNGINPYRGRVNTDFGRGFYTTDNYEKAKNWAERIGRAKKLNACVLLLAFDYENAESIIEHFSDDRRWGQFVINNRNGKDYVNRIDSDDHNLDGKYDITMGRIADFRVQYLSEILKSKMEKLDSYQRILNKDFPMQVVFHTFKALRYLELINYEYIDLGFKGRGE